MICVVLVLLLYTPAAEYQNLVIKTTDLGSKDKYLVYLIYLTVRLWLHKSWINQALLVFCTTCLRPLKLVTTLSGSS